MPYAYRLGTTNEVAVDPFDAIDQRMDLESFLPTLEKEDRKILSALAEHETLEEAANHLPFSYERVRQTRVRIGQRWRLWQDGKLRIVPRRRRNSGIPLD